MSLCKCDILCDNLEFVDPRASAIIQERRKPLPFLETIVKNVKQVSWWIGRCFAHVFQASKSAKAKLTGALTITAGKAVYNNPVLAKCVACSYTIRIWSTNFQVTKVDTATGDITIKVIGTQVVWTTIPAWANVCIFGNSQSPCGWSVKPRWFKTTTYQVPLQEIGMKVTECKRWNIISAQWGFKWTTGLDQDNFDYTFNQHLEFIQRTLAFGTAEKDIDCEDNCGNANYTRWLLSWADEYATEYDAWAALLTYDIVKEMWCKFKEDGIDYIDEVFMHPKTWKCLQKTLWVNCVYNCNNNGNNTIVAWANVVWFFLPGVDVDVMVTQWNEFPEDKILFRDSNNVMMLVDTFEANKRRLGQFIWAVPCAGGIINKDYSSVVWLAVANPTELGLLTNFTCA